MGVGRGALEAISKSAWVGAVHDGRMPFLVAWGRCYGNLCILLNLFENALSFCIVGFSLFFPPHFEQRMRNSLHTENRSLFISSTWTCSFRWTIRILFYSEREMCAQVTERDRKSNYGEMACRGTCFRVIDCGIFSYGVFILLL